MQSGFDDVIDKPYDLAMLLEMVRELSLAVECCYRLIADVTPSADPRQGIGRERARG